MKRAKEKAQIDTWKFIVNSQKRERRRKHVVGSRRPKMSVGKTPQLAVRYETACWKTSDVVADERSEASLYVRYILVCPQLRKAFTP